MAVSQPTPDQLKAAAAEVGLALTEADVQSYLGLIKPNIDAYNIVDAMPDNLPLVKYPRTPGYFPSAEENPRNAWYVKTSIKGAASGPLKGKKVAMKDNIMVAGVPMMNGNSILEGYTPEIDATVVQRVLDAGGEIVGKTHCESYCISGGSHTGAKGPVHNPYKMGYRGRRLVFGQRRGRGARRSRHGARRRSGRLHPHAILLVRHLRHETHAWSGSLHRDHADRNLRRSHGPHDQRQSRTTRFCSKCWPDPTATTRASIHPRCTSTPRSWRAA